MRRLCLLGFVAVTACTHSPTPLPPAVQAVVDVGERSQWFTLGDDPWEVFICHVPADTQSPTYAGLPLRRPLTADSIASILNTKVTDYFDVLSHGGYRPHFTAAGDVSMAPTDEPQTCVDKALAASSDTAHGVIAIADAEHNVNQPGGFASPGDGCSQPPCPASTTRRSAYVGASDFSPDWGDNPPMDLIEHELGHALGWPHSGDHGSQPEENLDSALDVMSNSAAPRDVKPERRDAPDTLAINRLQAGWLPTSAVAVVSGNGRTVTLAPSNAESGTRLAVVALDDKRMLTIELLTAGGFDDHLPATGVAVHLITGSDSTRTEAPLVGLPPYADLLTSGETFTGDGWRVSVGEQWRVTVQPVEDVSTVIT